MPESNVDKLRAVGVIKRKRLTPEQTDAINSLSDSQVDQLIAMNDQLESAVRVDATMLILPGRSAGRPGKPHKPTQKYRKATKPGKRGKGRAR